MISHQAAMEAVALKKFRPLAINLCHHEEELYDENLMKWLRARDFNVKAAEDLLRKAMLWRKTNKIDEITSWDPPQQFRSAFPYDTEGEDYEGFPVFVVPLGKWDLRRAYERGQRSLVSKYIDQMLEFGLEKARMKNMTDPGDKYVNQVVFIWDMEGLSMRSMASAGMVDACLDICKKLEGSYPEIMKISFTVNAPRIFALLFAIVKPIFTQRTLDKINIYGTNEEKWKAALKKHIPEYHLLEKYGGTRKPRAEFLDVISMGFDNFSDVFDLDEEMCVTTVDAGEKIAVGIDVKHPNSKLNWSFYTDDYDISFSLHFQDLDLTIINNGRVDSHLKKQEGSYTAVIPGRYLLIFDNSYSRWRQKTLYHNVTETPPEGVVKDDQTTLGVRIRN